MLQNLLTLVGNEWKVKWPINLITCSSLVCAYICADARVYANETFHNFEHQLTKYSNSGSIRTLH